MRWDSLQEYGRRSQQRGAGARRPGAAAEAAGAAAGVVPPGSDAARAEVGVAEPPAAARAPRLRDAHRARRRAEEHNEDRAQGQEPPHLPAISRAGVLARRTLRTGLWLVSADRRVPAEYFFLWAGSRVYLCRIRS